MHIGPPLGPLGMHVSAKYRPAQDALAGSTWPASRSGQNRAPTPAPCATGASPPSKRTTPPPRCALPHPGPPMCHASADLACPRRRGAMPHDRVQCRVRRVRSTTIRHKDQACLPPHRLRRSSSATHRHTSLGCARQPASSSQGDPCVSPVVIRAPRRPRAVTVAPSDAEGSQGIQGTTQTRSSRFSSRGSLQQRAALGTERRALPPR